MRSFYLLFAVLLLGPIMVQAQPAAFAKVNVPHPRIFLLKGEEAGIKDKIATDPFLAAVHGNIITKSNSFITGQLLKYEPVGGQLLKISRTALTHIYYLSYAWRMTGYKPYADKAKEEVLNVCAFKDWSPGHFLDVAEMTAAVSIGYDWLYDLFTPAERQVIEQSIIKKGLNESLPEKASAPENYSWLKKKNNWNSVCNTGMAMGAIAIFEKIPELAPKIIDRSVKLVRDVALKEYLPDGNYPEGYTYWSYGTTYNIFLITLLEKIYGNSFGLGNHAGFMKTPEYILQMSTQDMTCYAYSDCFTGFTFSFPMLWFANRTGDHSMLWGEAEKYAYMKKINMNADQMFDVRYLPSVMLWSGVQPFSNMKKPQKRLYVGQGTTPVALLRNHWGGDDEIFVGMKGGSCLTNHSHMDIGSFVMYRGKNHWITDLGAQDYNSLEKYGIMLGDRSQDSHRWDALKLSNKIHNVMIFNGAKQQVSAMVNIDESGDRKGMVYAISNLDQLDSPWIRQHQRGVAIVNDSYVVVRDELSNSGKFTDARWAMLTPADVRIIDSSSAELTMNGDKLLVKVEGQGIQLRTWSTASDQSFDEDNGKTLMLGFMSLLQPGQSRAFTVYLIPSGAQVSQPVAPLKDWKK